MEYEIIKTLDFNITVPSVYRFLERYSKLANSDDLIFNYSKYLIELTLLDIKMLSWKPSLIAASAIYISKKIMKRSNIWSELMTTETQFDEKMVRSCSREICYILNEVHKKPQYKSILKKYSTEKFMEVANIVPSAMND